MGANEHGVVIGNEGVQARSPAPEQDALTGMDLVRLALERGRTASEAVEVLIALLTRHGQGGNCGHITPAYYNNSFIIADPEEGFVFETVGRDWILERVDGVRSISNCYSIREKACRVSGGLKELISSNRWASSSEGGYADAISHPTTHHIGHSLARQQRSTALLSAREGSLTVSDIARILRDHGTDSTLPSEWSPEHESKRTLCLHALTEELHAQTTGSLISEVSRRGGIHWVTGTAAPCISIFKPALIDVPLGDAGPRPTDRFQRGALWWEHEQLHRAVLRSPFGKFLADITQERDALEREFEIRVKEVLDGGDVAERARVVSQCWRQAIETEHRWRRLLGQSILSQGSAYAAAWARFSALAAMGTHA
jgi:dipeptidase